MKKTDHHDEVTVVIPAQGNVEPVISGKDVKKNPSESMSSNNDKTTIIPMQSGLPSQEISHSDYSEQNDEKTVLFPMLQSIEEKSKDKYDDKETMMILRKKRIPNSALNQTLKIYVLLKGLVVDEHELKGNEITIGRNPSNTIVLDHSEVSRFHAKLLKQGTSYQVIDNKSKNGILVNNMDVKESTLENNDFFEITPFILQFKQLEKKNLKVPF